MLTLHPTATVHARHETSELENSMMSSQGTKVQCTGLTFTRESKRVHRSALVWAGQGRALT